MIHSARRAIVSIHAAERDLQNARLFAERRQVVAAVDAGLRGQHASKVAAVVARFADRRAALGRMTDPAARAATARQIAMEEADELARVAVEHAIEKHRLRISTLGSLSSRHRDARRSLRRCQRQQQAVLAVHLRALKPKAARQRISTRARISRRLVHVAVT